MGKYAYEVGNIRFEGSLFLPEGDGRVPCVLVAHAWDGPNAYFNAMAEELAKAGYAAFAIDVYGQGVRGKVDGDNSHLMNPLLADRTELKRRLLGAFKEARLHPRVDPGRLGILGFCFGGLCALDLARANPEGLKCAVSVHGPLHAPSTSPDKIDSSVLVLHGWEDPVARPEAVLAFADEMTKAQADWQVHAYGHAKHAFTFEGADIPALGIKYDRKAHERSRSSTARFLVEVFGESFDT